MCQYFYLYPSVNLVGLTLTVRLVFRPQIETHLCNLKKKRMEEMRRVREEEARQRAVMEAQRLREQQEAQAREQARLEAERMRLEKERAELEQAQLLREELEKMERLKRQQEEEEQRQRREKELEEQRTREAEQQRLAAAELQRQRELEAAETRRRREEELAAERARREAEMAELRRQEVAAREAAEIAALEQQRRRREEEAARQVQEQAARQAELERLERDRVARQQRALEDRRLCLQLREALAQRLASEQVARLREREGLEGWLLGSGHVMPTCPSYTQQSSNVWATYSLPFLLGRGLVTMTSPSASAASAASNAKATTKPVTCAYARDICYKLRAWQSTSPHTDQADAAVANQAATAPGHQMHSTSLRPSERTGSGRAVSAQSGQMAHVGVLDEAYLGANNFNSMPFDLLDLS